MQTELSKMVAASLGIAERQVAHTLDLLEGGANLRAIQCMLGHESIATTEIYTHIDRQMLRSEIIEHHPRNILYRKNKNKGEIH